ncbi:hypothetical protein [uncultured Devosia sp.]|uniref:hypothetical protein n=1 Tax=uncultured Devosia sp. TaxID=211434 RepID=UPI00260A9902|nr:hypothetical protein [uncultured Devosia sp.]
MPAAAVPRQIYDRLRRRNRIVGLLRLGVPVLGSLVLAGLLVQIFLASFSSRFSIDQLSVSPEAVVIDAPEYVGTLTDGSSYRVWAETARARADRSDLIDLINAQLVLNRVDGVQLTMQADAAQLDTTHQLTLVPGVAEVADSTGTTGTLNNSIFDWDSQVLTTKGAVSIDYADGSTIRAEGLVYDAATVLWTFTGSVVTLPSTPGEDDSDTIGEGTR